MPETRLRSRHVLSTSPGVLASLMSARRQLNLLSVQICRYRGVDNPLRPIGATAASTAHSDVSWLGHHAHRQYDADRAGEAQFVPDAIELGSCQRTPNCPKRGIDPRKRSAAHRAAQPPDLVNKLVNF